MKKINSSFLDLLMSGYLLYSCLIAIPLIGYAVGNLITGGIDLLGLSTITWQIIVGSWVAVFLGYAVTRDKLLLAPLLIIPVVVPALGSLLAVNPMLNTDASDKVVAGLMPLMGQLLFTLVVCGGAASVWLIFDHIKTRRVD